jgi:cytochrome c-type biogenesis protein CcmH/NrfG
MHTAQAVTGLIRTYRDQQRAEDLAHWLEILGDCWMAQKRGPDAAAAYREALEIQDQLLGSDDPRTLALADRLHIAEQEK